jgi:antirestriction protein ArdC
MMNSHAAQWQKLLDEAITKPGLLLAAYSHFHNYSVGNQVLAISQCGQRGLEPGPLATFPTWKERGRFVRRGEKALMLCMPITFKDKVDPEAKHTGFIYKPRWFVLSQTDGDPVEAEAAPAWSKSLALSALGISEIAFDLTDGNTQGFARKRSISISPLAVLPHKTTFHELAHVVLGHTIEADFSDATDLPRDVREVEAECVALICCESLGLSGADYSRGYIQNWLQGKDEIPERSAQRIFSAADSILKAGVVKETIN